MEKKRYRREIAEEISIADFNPKLIYNKWPKNIQNLQRAILPWIVGYARQ